MLSLGRYGQECCRVGVGASKLCPRGHWWVAEDEMLWKLVKNYNLSAIQKECFLIPHEDLYPPPIQLDECPFVSH